LKSIDLHASDEPLFWIDVIPGTSRNQKLTNDGLVHLKVQVVASGVSVVPGRVYRIPDMYRLADPIEGRTDRRTVQQIDELPAARPNGQVA
jgi:hypothetical protein